MIITFAPKKEEQGKLHSPSHLPIIFPLFQKETNVFDFDYQNHSITSGKKMKFGDSKIVRCRNYRRRRTTFFGF
ncbi:Uncharacterised protein [Chryseobacterium balustinum]|uniref:Uncharacterized protein n=1 Tax=Chryseobacterium balustinum TaxID=246 RepID=A0AAX2IGC3_9FLAO|nr:hypothetical protein [Chryseobacterium balustinum]SQA87700.1 Uncharacterised protein [Chryseobacterium balustinum]